ncbi:MAG TPA: hypothetical protein DCW41_06445 [Clostridiales bacterium]|nr:hypothetical protein [Clostridiales bacterium]
MTIKEARIIIDKFNRNNNYSEDEEFEYIEALDFMIKTTGEPRYMMMLGGYYYGQKDYDLALKYYDMASELGYDEADECLGYVWYYGRTGRKDYEKAFKHFSAAAKRGNIVAEYKIADMYKNGYFVEKDYDKYKEIIKGIYPKIKDTRYLGDPLPEVFTRLARIRTEEGDQEAAAKLYLQAKSFLGQRIMYNPFFGNLNIMKWLVEDLYKIVEPDPLEADLFDLYYWLTRPCSVTFRAKGKPHTVSCVEEDGEYVIDYEGKWFRTVDDFFKKATAEGKLLTDLYTVLDDFVIREGDS